MAERKPMSKRILPVQQLAILAICRFAEPISLTSIFPYLPEMMESFGVAQDDIAFWAGRASAIYSFSQCLTAIFWVRLSDRFGRKPIILLCLANTMLTSLFWGFTTTLPMALVARALSGAGNGNVGIIRTMVAEMCPWKELQPRAFSIMPLIYNMGSVLGPLIGGALANPYHRPPTEPPTSRVLDRFPYALPNLVSAAFFLVGLTTGTLYLKETLAERRGRRDSGLILGAKINAAVRRVVYETRHAFDTHRPGERDPLLESNRTSRSSKTDGDGEELPPRPALKRLPPPSMMDVLNKQSSLNLIVYTMIAMNTIAYDQLIPVFLHHPRQPLDSPDVQLPFKFRSGFSATSSQIGMLFTLFGVSNIFFQLVVFPPVAQKYGILNCMRVCVIVYPLLFFLTPFAVLIPGFAGIATLFTLWLGKGLAGSFAFPCSTILLTNSASSLRALGTLNGIATSVSAVGRAAGPTVGGFFFTYGLKHDYIILGFWVFGIIAAISAIPVFFLIEGDGFGQDDTPPGLDDSADEDADDDEDEEEEIVHARTRPIVVVGREMEDEESEYGDIGQLIGRSPPRNSSGPSWSAASSVVDADSNNGDAGDVNFGPYGGMAALDRVSTAPTAGASSRPPREQQQQQQLERTRNQSVDRALGRPRQRSSVPLGMGRGFRRLSSNLGQSMSGYGTGNGIAG